MYICASESIIPWYRLVICRLFSCQATAALPTVMCLSNTIHSSPARTAYSNIYLKKNPCLNCLYYLWLMCPTKQNRLETLNTGEEIWAVQLLLQIFLSSTSSNQRKSCFCLLSWSWLHQLFVKKKPVEFILCGLILEIWFPRIWELLHS